MFKKSKKYKTLNLETGASGLQLMLKRKLERGEELSRAERHLLGNISGLRNNLFAPSLSSACLQSLLSLLLPIVVVSTLIIGTAQGYHYLTTDASTLAQEREDREVRRAVELAEQGLALDSDFSFHESSFRHSVNKESGVYKVALVNFIQGLISTYQPQMADSKRLALEIVEVSEKEDIDPFYVAAVIASESSFSPRARSSVGALGLMQLMPATAKEVSKRRTGKNRYPILTHPRTNLELGVDYLKSLEKKFGGNRHYALAAYNWGPANVRRANKKQRRIPNSVENYSRKILEKTLRWQRRFKSIESEVESELKDLPLQEARASIKDVG